MSIRGMDISNHQVTMDVATVVKSNAIDFVFVLSNDGTFKNQYFAAQVAAARNAGALVAAYVYARPNWQQTVQTVLSQVPKDMPVIVDFEDGSGGTDVLWATHRALWEAGYSTPVMYLPKYVWQAIGSPSLIGLPALWKSWYADSKPHGYDEALAMTPPYVWDPYGGLPVEILQFTGTGRLVGYNAAVDLNFYPGDRDGLAVLLGGDDEMTVSDADVKRIVEAVWAEPLTEIVGEPDKVTGEYDTWTQPAGTMLKAMWGQTFNPTGKYPGAHMLAAKMDELLERPTATVDAAALAAELGPLLAGLPAELIVALVKALCDEIDRRARMRANLTVPPVPVGPPSSGG